MLTVAQVAERLNLSKQCVYALVEAGLLAVHRFGLGRGAIRISEEDFRAYRLSCRIEPEEVTEDPVARRKTLKHIDLN